MEAPPTIAIIGRPNVGKSTLFNRLTNSRQAITTDIPGTTRDRISRKLQIGEYQVLLVDTGGLEYGKQENIESNIQAQAQIAIEDADLILFVTDARYELTVDDFTAASLLRNSKKTTILVANKCDNQELDQMIYNLFELGFGEAVTVSAIHKFGIQNLEFEIGKKLKELGFKSGMKKELELETPTGGIDIAILGKPNAGKSSLFNALIGKEKVIVSDIPGTTRDSIDTELQYQDQVYTLIDTAGLRRRGKIEKGIEKYSSLRSFSAIERSEIVVLVIDGEKGITKQDPRIVQHIVEAQKGLIIAINKSDLFEKGEEIRQRIIAKLRRTFAFVPWAPVIFISAKNKRNTYKVLEIASEIMEERKKRIPTQILNGFFQKITFKHPPASTKNKKPKFMYATQADICPPNFILFFKHAANIHFSYKRYLENEIRKEYGFNGTAINLKFKGDSAVPKSPK